MLTDPFMVAFALLAGHALADYPLQGEFVALFKDRFGKGGSSGPLGPIWPWILGSHAVTHGAFVLLATGLPVCALAEVAIHAITDDAKCAKRIGFNADQSIHLVCKAAWFAIWLVMR